TDAAPLLQLGQIYLWQNRIPAAEDAFNRALARNPSSAAANAGLAEVRLRQGDWPAALNLWHSAAGNNPNLPGVFTAIGQIHLSRLEFDAAQAAFEQQQEHAPDPAANWYLAALSAPRDVAAANARLLAIPPDAPADVLARRDYLLAALVPFTAESPPAETAQAAGIALAQIDQWPLAIHALQIARDAGQTYPPPFQAKTLAFLGHALAQNGNPALDLFEQARRLNSTSALPAYFYGIYLREQGALNAAENEFQQALELDPDNAAVYAELAQTNIEQGNLAAAEEMFAAAVAAAPGNPAMKLLQVKFYATRGYRVAEAGIPAAEALVKADETNAEAHDWLGWMYLLGGQPEKAEASLRRAVELEPNLVSARYHLARLLRLSGRPAEAAAEYRRVIDWDTTNIYRERAINEQQ
ncbi:MAG: tetratricopeptide repeat protein, partial [Chloroflexi bacterium]